MVLAWLGMEQLVERKISFFFVCGMSASFVITSLLMGHVLDGISIFLTAVSWVLVLLDAPPCFITYPPVTDPHIGGCHRETAVAIPFPSFRFMKMLPLPKKDNK